MSRWIPTAQRCDYLLRRTRRHVAALDGEKTRVTHRRPMRRLDVALCELREIHLVENGKRAELGNGIGACDGQAPEQKHKPDGCSREEASRWFRGFKFHERRYVMTCGDGCKFRGSS